MEQKLNLFISNLKEIEAAFKWQRGMITKLTALLYTLEDRPASGADVREAQELVKEHFGIFSYFRGHLNLCVSALLALSENPQTLAADTLVAYEMLKDAKFHASDYLAVAALQLAAHTEREKLPQRVERARAFYDGMKQQHWFITGEDDYIYAAMLALSDIDPVEGSRRIEEMYDRIKEEFSLGNGAQSLAEILVLGGQTEMIVERVLALSQAFRDQGIKMDRVYTLPVLGVLALLPVEADTIVRETERVKDYLKEQKGFGFFSVSGQELLLYTSALVTAHYADELKGKMTAALSTGIASILIAQQAALIAAITASSVAAASASS